MPRRRKRLRLRGGGFYECRSQSAKKADETVTVLLKKSPRLSSETMILGRILGRRMRGLFNEAQFRTMFFVGLIVAGCYMLWITQNRAGL